MNYICETYFSSELSEKQIGDFIIIQCSVFPATPMTRADFQTKFLDNIYGDSIIVLIYDEAGVPAAARALWRNDICGRLAFQPSDTAVRKEHRRQGLFVTMTKAALEMVPDDALIYNFPNGNSYPQYMKLGWKNYKIQFTRFFTPWQYLKEDDTVIEDSYLKWWILPRTDDHYGYVKSFGKYYLVRRLNNAGRYIVFGQLSTDGAALFPRVHPKLLIYHSAKRPFYNRNAKVGCKIVALNATPAEKIPNWKTDVL